MNDDYLWDGSGAPDPDVQRLEQVLGRLRTPSRSLPPMGSPEGRRDGNSVVGWRTARFLGPALAAAAAIVLMVGSAWRTARTSSSSAWDVASLAGQPRIGSTSIAGAGHLAVGQTLVTDAVSRARVGVSTIGSVTIDGNTRVRLVATRTISSRSSAARCTRSSSPRPVSSSSTRRPRRRRISGASIRCMSTRTAAACSA